MPKSSGCRYHLVHNTHSTIGIWHPGDSAPQVGRYVMQHTGWSVVGAQHPFFAGASGHHLCPSQWKNELSLPCELFAVSDCPKTSPEIITTNTVCSASESHCTRYLNILCTPEWHKGKILVKLINLCWWPLFHSPSWQMLPTHHSCEFWNYFGTITDSAHFSSDRPWRNVNSSRWLQNSQAGETWATWSLVLTGLPNFPLPYAWEFLQAVVTGAILAWQDSSITPHLWSLYSDHLCWYICTSQ